jgi:hypothetical protein
MDLVAQRHARGDVRGALEILQGALAELEQRKSPPMSLRVLYSFQATEAYRNLRLFEEALESSQASQRWLNAISDETDPVNPANEALMRWIENERCSLIGQRGWIYLDWGRLEAARAAFEEERRELEALGELRDPASLMDSHRHRATLAVTTGQPEEIEKILEEHSADLTAPQRAFLGVARASAGLEAAARAGTGLEAARAPFEEALSDPGLSPIDEASCHLRLAELELLLDRKAEARARCEDGRRKLEALGADGSVERRRWLGIASILAPPEELPRWRTELERESEGFLEEWSALSARESGYGFLLLDRNLQLFNALTTTLLALEGSEQGAQLALECLARAHALSGLSRSCGAASPTVARLRETLCRGEKQGVLVYLAGAFGSWVFALDQTRLHAVPLASHYVVERELRRLSTALVVHAGHWSDAAHAAAERLGKELLPPEVQELLKDWDSLSVCGLDLFRVDALFELLALGDGRRIGETKAVWILPPLAAAAEFARRSSSTQPVAPGIRLIAAPSLTPAMAERFGVAEFELPEHALEQMLDAFPPEVREVHRGKDAHVGALASAPTPVLQFLAHGVFDEARSSSAELLLASRDGRENGVLSARGLEQVLAGHGAPRVALLTSCRAGREARRAGDPGASGLAGAFLAGGSSAVIASEFDLELELAMSWSRAFYDALVRGTDVAEAGRAARAELARDPRFANNAQPGLLHVIGTPTTVFKPVMDEERPASASRLWVVALGLVLLVGLVLVGVRLGKRRP